MRGVKGKQKQQALKEIAPNLDIIVSSLAVKEGATQQNRALQLIKEKANAQRVRMQISA